MISKVIGRRRAGTTLIEVLGTLSVLLILGISAAGILNSVTAVGERSNAAKQTRAAIQRLAKQFRQDVDQSQSVVATDDTLPLKITKSDSVIHYQLDPATAQIQRAVATHNGETKLTEGFLISAADSVEIRIREELVTLEITGETFVQSWIIEAGR